MGPTRNDSEGDGAFSDSDQQWFDRLSGRPVAVSDPQVLREADALRRAIALDQSAARNDERVLQAVGVAEQIPRWERLVFRLRQERLLDSSSVRRRGWMAALTAVAAAVVLAVILVPRMQVDDRVYYDEPPTLRGEINLVQRQDDHPRRAAEAVAKALAHAGLRVTLYQQTRTFFVDVRIAPEELEAARASLLKLGIQPKPGLTRVEFDPR